MSKFTYGDSVQTTTTAPSWYRPGDQGWICGIRNVDSATVADSMGEPVGTTVYLVEFEDGSAMEIPERVLEKIHES